MLWSSGMSSHLVAPCPFDSMYNYPVHFILACVTILFWLQMPPFFFFWLQVVDKLQSGGKSKRDGWRTELPTFSLGHGVIDVLKEDKKKDVAWQGKCSGTVYVYIFNPWCILALLWKWRKKAKKYYIFICSFLILKSWSRFCTLLYPLLKSLGLFPLFLCCWNNAYIRLLI